MTETGLAHLERIATALERIADKLDLLSDDDAGSLLRIEVVPR